MIILSIIIKFITVVCRNQYHPGLNLLAPSSGLPSSKAGNEDIMIINVAIILDKPAHLIIRLSFVFVKLNKY